MPGQTVQIPVRVSDLSGQNVTSFQFDFTYNEAVLRIDSVITAGTISAAYEPNVLGARRGAGNFRVGGFGLQPLQGSGTLFILRGTIQAGGSTNITPSGDFNAAQPPQAVFNPTSAPVSGGNVGLSIPDTIGTVGATGTLPVRITDVTGQNVTSFQFDVLFNPSSMRITGVQTQGTLSSGFAQVAGNVIGNGVAPDTFRVAGFGLTPISGSGTLVNLQVEFLAEGAGIVTIAAPQLNNGTPAAFGTTNVVNVTLSDVFAANLAGFNEVPPRVTTATGQVTATLDGDTLIVSGSFSGLTSKLVPIGGTPAHIHMAPAGRTGGIVIPLNVTANSDSLGGTIAAANNRFALTAAQRTALQAGNLYVNIHTQLYRPGEIRGQLLREPNAAPTQARIISPANGGAVTIAGGADSTVTIDWTTSTDPNGNRVVYNWQLAADPNFSTPLVYTSTDTVSSLTLRFGAIDSLLNLGGVQVGQSITLYHRANALDGSLRTVGQTATVQITRGGVGNALVQLIHVAPDAALTEVDVYLNGVRMVDNLAFRRATDFMSIPAGAHTVAITRGTAANANNPISSFEVTVERDVSYIAILAGTQQANNFGLYAVAGAPMASGGQNETDLIVFNASPDAGAIDIDLISDDPTHVNLGTITEGLVYLEGDTATVATGGVNLSVQANGDTVNVFRFDLGALGGQVLTLAATGYVNPPAGQDQFGFQLIGVTRDGAVLTARVVTGVEAGSELPTAFEVHGNYPNPFNPSTTIRFDLPETAEVSIEVVDMLGRKVMAVPAQMMQAGSGRMVEINAASLASGTYLYRVIAKTANGSDVKVGKMMLVK